MVEHVRVAVDLDHELIVHDDINAKKVNEVLSADIARVQDAQCVRKLCLASSSLMHYLFSIVIMDELIFLLESLVTRDDLSQRPTCIVDLGRNFLFLHLKQAIEHEHVIELDGSAFAGLEVVHEWDPEFNHPDARHVE